MAKFLCLLALIAALCLCECVCPLHRFMLCVCVCLCMHTRTHVQAWEMFHSCRRFIAARWQYASIFRALSLGAPPSCLSAVQRTRVLTQEHTRTHTPYRENEQARSVEYRCVRRLYSGIGWMCWALVALMLSVSEAHSLASDNETSWHISAEKLKETQRHFTLVHVKRDEHWGNNDCRHFYPGVQQPWPLHDTSKRGIRRHLIQPWE